MGPRAPQQETVARLQAAQRLLDLATELAREALAELEIAEAELNPGGVRDFELAALEAIARARARP